MVRKRRKEAKLKQDKRTEVVVSPDKASRYNLYAIGGLTVLFLVVYLTTMLGGVSSGDSAELQYCSRLLGICHPPGVPDRGQLRQTVYVSADR